MFVKWRFLLISKKRKINWSKNKLNFNFLINVIILIMIYRVEFHVCFNISYYWFVFAWSFAIVKCQMNTSHQNSIKFINYAKTIKQVYNLIKFIYFKTSLIGYKIKLYEILSIILFRIMELSFWHKLKSLDPNIFATWWCKPLIFQTLISWSIRIHSLKYLRSTTLCYKDIKIRKSEFVVKTPFLCIFSVWCRDSLKILLKLRNLKTLHT